MSERLPVKRYRLYRARDKKSKGLWLLEIDGARVRIVQIDASGERMVAEFHESESHAYFLPISFLGNRSYHGLILDGTIIDVESSEGGPEAIRRLLDRAFVQKTPYAATRTLLSGVVQAILGFGLAIVALIVTVLSHEQAKEQNADGFTVWWGGMLMGCIWGCCGLFQMSRFTSLYRTAQKVKKSSPEIGEPIQSKSRLGNPSPAWVEEQNNNEAL